MMHPHIEINLMGEILPVSLLKCKSALDAMYPRELLCIKTDDQIVIDKMTKLIRNRKYKMVRQDRSGDDFTVYIMKE